MCSTKLVDLQSLLLADPPTHSGMDRDATLSWLQSSVTTCSSIGAFGNVVIRMTSGGKLWSTGTAYAAAQAQPRHMKYTASTGKPGLELVCANAGVIARVACLFTQQRLQPGLWHASVRYNGCRLQAAGCSHLCQQHAWWPLTVSEVEAGHKQLSDKTQAIRGKVRQRARAKCAHPDGGSTEVCRASWIRCACDLWEQSGTTSRINVLISIIAACMSGDLTIHHHPTVHPSKPLAFRESRVTASADCLSPSQAATYPSSTANDSPGGTRYD